MPLILLVIALLEAGGSTSAGTLHLYGTSSCTFTVQMSALLWKTIHGTYRSVRILA